MAKSGHFDHLAHLLTLEAEEEEKGLADESHQSGVKAERSGSALTNLVIRDEHPALGGRVIATLAKRNQTQPLPWNRLSVGSPVLMTVEGSTDKRASRGVVCGRNNQTIEVALAHLPDSDEQRPTYRLALSSDEMGRQRQRAALNEAKNATRARLAQLRDVLVGERPPRFAEIEPLTPLDDNLNEAQIQAVQFGLTAQDVAIIHGPPGTGKTTTVVELIRQSVRRGERVLACAPSNLAVDNLLQRLIAAGEKAIRIGHPARVLPELQEHTLDLVVDAHPDVALARKLIREAQILRDKAARYTRAKPLPGARQELRREASELVADARRIEEQLVEHLLDTTPILCATLTGLDSQILKDRTFDLVVIDEASQATEPACWIPIPRAGRLIFAGDHCQLPPTVVSVAAAKQGLAMSLMERFVSKLGSSISRLLNIQYRMHSAIMGFSSHEFYGSSLIAHSSNESHLLADLPGMVASPLTTTPLEFVDTAGANYDEEFEPDGESRFNPAEAELVGRRVTVLLEAGLVAADIGVITPYAAQVRLLREQLAREGLEIDTVDGFQGREKEAVVISLVRSNTKGEIGFLADTRRMNVAMTRARRKLVVIGDSATIGGHPFYARMLAWFEQQGAYKTVWEEPAD
jgi:ATP-dependent RNA/DNA helicase IGHMBP2